MRPVVVVVGLDYADARRYVLARQDTRPGLQGARLVSADRSAHLIRSLEAGSLLLGRVVAALTGEDLAT
jgi:hypothetical protein